VIVTFAVLQLPHSRHTLDSINTGNNLPKKELYGQRSVQGLPEMRSLVAGYNNFTTSTGSLKQKPPSSLVWGDISLLPIKAYRCKTLLNAGKSLLF